MLLILTCWNNKSFFFFYKHARILTLGSFEPQNFPINLIDEKLYDNQDQIKMKLKTTANWMDYVHEYCWQGEGGFSGSLLLPLSALCGLWQHEVLAEGRSRQPEAEGPWNRLSTADPSSMPSSHSGSLQGKPDPVRR